MKRSLVWGSVAMLVLFWAFLWRRQKEVPPAPVSNSEEQIQAVVVPISPKPVIPLPVQIRPVATLPDSFLIPNVPFTLQAPNAEWGNPTFQDACEEAAIIMAEAWVNKKTLSKESVKKEIEALVVFEKKKFGQAVDTSLADTSWLLRNYFSLTTSEVKTGITIDDIREAVAASRIVIVPTDGQKLKNPNFKQPGPARHMVLITGYDTKTKEFIANDPGTRKGKDYRYPEAVLFEAILDYATGNHVPVISRDKVMLTVWQG